MIGDIRHKTLYLSGPMTGLPDFNRPAFLAAEEHLRKAGFALIVNLARLCKDIPDDAPRETFMARCMEAMETNKDCGILVQLPGWQTSKGAREERCGALEMEWPIMGLEDLIDD